MHTLCLVQIQIRPTNDVLANDGFHFIFQNFKFPCTLLQSLFPSPYLTLTLNVLQLNNDLSSVQHGRFWDEQCNSSSNDKNKHAFSIPPTHLQCQFPNPDDAVFHPSTSLQQQPVGSVLGPESANVLESAFENFGYVASLLSTLPQLATNVSPHMMQSSLSSDPGRINSSQDQDRHIFSSIPRPPSLEQPPFSSRNYSNGGVMQSDPFYHEKQNELHEY